MTFRPILSIALLAGLLWAAAFGTQAAPAEKQTFVLVHGATAGAWEWKRTGQFLADDGHTVYRATLTGLGEREHLNSPDIDLQTHINDVVNLILFEDLHDVVLTGHSYGGMVVTGVMDRIPERIRHVVFLDAAVPQDGQSIWDLFGNRGPLRFGFYIEGRMSWFATDRDMSVSETTARGRFDFVSSLNDPEPIQYQLLGGVTVRFDPTRR